MARKKVTRRTERHATEPSTTGDALKPWVTKRSDVTGLNAFDEFQRALDLHTDSSASDLTSPYKQLPSYYAGNRVIWDALLRGEWQLWIGARDDATQIEEGPLYDLFRKPNAAQTWRQFVSQIVVMMHGKAGAAYIHLAGKDIADKTPLGWPEELRLIPPSRVEAKLSSDDIFVIEKWAVRRGHGEPALLDPDDVIPLYVAPDDEMPWTAVSPLTPGGLDNDSERMAGHYTRSTLRSGGTPGILFSYKGEADIPEDDRNVIEAKLEARYGGTKGSRFAVVGGEWGVDNLGFAPRDMEFSTWRAQHVNITSRLLGITPLVLSQFEGASGLGDAGLRVQRRILYENKILPLASLIQEALDRIVKQCAPDVEGIFNFDKVEALQEDVGQKLVALEVLLRSGVTLERAVSWLDLGIDLEGHTWAGTYLVGPQLVPAELVVDGSLGAIDMAQGAEANQALAADAPALPAPDATATKAGGELKVDNDAALNGAQLSSIMELLVKITDGTLPRDAVKGILEVGFNLDSAEAERIIGSTKAAPRTERVELMAAAVRALPVDRPVHAVVFAKEQYATAQTVLTWLRASHDEGALVDAIAEGEDLWVFLVRRRVDFNQASLTETELEPGVVVITGDLRPGERALLTNGSTPPSDGARHHPADGASVDTPGDTTSATPIDASPDEDPVTQRALRVATAQAQWVRALRGRENELDAKIVRAMQKMSRDVMRAFQREAKHGLRAYLHRMASVAEHDPTPDELDRLTADLDVQRRAPTALTQRQIDEILAKVGADSLAKAAASTVARTYEVGVGSGWKVLKDLGVEHDGLLDFQKNRMPALVSQMTDRYLEGSPLVRVNDKIRNEVNAAILNNMELGSNIETTAKDIRGVFKASLQRSRTIARTETGIAMNLAKMDLFVDQGVEEHEWIAVIDDNTRGSHLDADGEKVAIGQPFPYVGLRHPNDPTGAPGEIINCRCTTIPVSLRDRDTVKPPPPLPPLPPAIISKIKKKKTASKTAARKKAMRPAPEPPKPKPGKIQSPAELRERITDPNMDASSLLGERDAGTLREYKQAQVDLDVLRVQQDKLITQQNLIADEVNAAADAIDDAGKQRYAVAKAKFDAFEDEINGMRVREDDVLDTIFTARRDTPWVMDADGMIGRKAFANEMSQLDGFNPIDRRHTLLDHANKKGIIDATSSSAWSDDLVFRDRQRGLANERIESAADFYDQVVDESVMPRKVKTNWESLPDGRSLAHTKQSRVTIDPNAMADERVYLHEWGHLLEEQNERGHGLVESFLEKKARDADAWNGDWGNVRTVDGADLFDGWGEGEKFIAPEYFKKMDRIFFGDNDVIGSKAGAYAGKVYPVRDSVFTPGYIDDVTGKIVNEGGSYVDTWRLDNSELISMGMEALGKDPVKFAREMPDFFDLMVDILSGGK